MSLALMDLIAYGATNFVDAQAVSDGTIQKAWTAIYLFDILQFEPIGIEAARIVFWSAAIAITCGILGFRSRLACLIAGALCIYWSGLNYSFSKVHHEKVVYAFALLSLPLAPVGARLSIDSLLDRLRKARRGEDPCAVPRTSAFALSPLRLVQLTLAIGYGFAGCTKLAIAGLEWANGYTLMGILIRYNNDWSAFAVQNVAVSRFLSIGTLVVQGTFPLILFFPRLRWFYLPSALGFHLVAWKTMDTGPYFTMWLFLIVFLPLERIPKWIGNAVGSGHAGRILWSLTVAGVPTFLILFVFSLYFPWYSFVLLVPAALALCLPLVRGSSAVVTVANAKQRAWIDALDWSSRLSLNEEFGALKVVDTLGVIHTGRAARRELAWRLPVLIPVALLLGRRR